MPGASRTSSAFCQGGQRYGATIPFSVRTLPRNRRGRSLPGVGSRLRCAGQPLETAFSQARRSVPSDWSWIVGHSHPVVATGNASSHHEHIVKA